MFVFFFLSKVARPVLNMNNSESMLLGTLKELQCRTFL